MAISLDTDTQTEYLAGTTLAVRTSAIIAALSGTVTVKVYDGSDVERGSGTIAGSWASVDGATITVGEVSVFTISSGGTPDDNWYVSISNGTRWIRGTFGIAGSVKDFVWSGPNFETGDTGDLGTIEFTAINPNLLTAPENTAVPTVSGTPEVGQTLTLDAGTWTGEPAPTYTYQWLRDGVSISAATGQTYTLVAADEDALISVRVTAANSQGTTQETSAAVGPVTIPVVALAFSGVPSTVTLNTSGTYTGLPSYVSGGTTPYSYSATGLPAGVSINANTGALTGDGTTAADTYAGITVTVTDANASTASATFALAVTVRYRVITDAMIANANAHRVANTEQYVRAVGQVASSLPTHYWHSATCAVLYRVTGNATYRDKVLAYFDYVTAVSAKSFAELQAPVVEDFRDLRRDSSFDIGDRHLPVAYAFDMMYDELSPERRQAVSTWLLDWADYLVYEAASPAMLQSRIISDSTWVTTVYGQHPYTTYRGSAANNYWWKYAAAMIGVMVAADDTGVGSSGYSGSRQAWHLNDWAQRWIDQAKWLFDKTDDSGAGNGMFKESSSYDSTGNVLPIVFAYNETGISPEYAQHPFIQAVPNARVQIFMPGEVYRANYGDQASTPKDTRTYGDRTKSMLAASVPGVSAADKARLHKWLSGFNTSAANAGHYITLELLYCDAVYAPATDYSGAALQLVSGPGIISVSRNSWTDANTSIIVYTGGAPMESHQYKAAGALVWWKGDNNILANANMYSASGILATTLYHNVPHLVGPNSEYVGQYWAYYNDPTGTKHWHEAIGGDYAGGSSAFPNGYQYSGPAPLGYIQSSYNGVSYLSQYTRKFLYVSALDAMVVLDRCQLNTAKVTNYTRRYRWWGSRIAPQTVSGSDFTLIGKSTTHKLFGRFVSGETAIAGSDEIELINTNVVGPVYCVQAEKTGTDVDRVMTVLQAATVGTTSAPRSVSALIQSVSGSAYRGCAIGSTVVMFADADSTYTATGYETAATTHYVTDCVPSRAYTITQQPSGGGSTETTYNATASTQGILRFGTTNSTLKRFVLS